VTLIATAAFVGTLHETAHEHEHEDEHADGDDHA
jgi:hypothetical protein